MALAYAYLCSTVCKAPFTRYNLFSNRFDNRVNVCIHDTTGCHTGCQTGLTTGCIVYTNIQPGCLSRFNNWRDNWLYRVYCRLSIWFYNPVWQPVERTLQPVERTVAVRSDGRLFGTSQKVEAAVLKQCGLGRGLALYQMASRSV